jgi:hypothetical protein
MLVEGWKHPFNQIHHYKRASPRPSLLSLLLNTFFHIYKMSTDPKKAAQTHAALLDSLKKAADEYPKPESVRFSYGTAGFRTL